MKWLLLGVAWTAGWVFAWNHLDQGWMLLVAFVPLAIAWIGQHVAASLPPSNDDD